MLTEFITWTANPALYDGFIEIRWYGLFFAIGFIVGYNMMERMFRHEQVNLKWLDSLFIYVVIATVLGARLGHCLFYAWDYYSQHPLEILKVRFGESRRCDRDYYRHLAIFPTGYSPEYVVDF